MTFLNPLARQGLLQGAPIGGMPVAPVIPVSGQQPSLPPVVQQAYQQYPILQKLGLQFKTSPASADGNMLESWVPGEPGTPDRPRPKEFDTKKLGIELYGDKTRPVDILGDVVSHQLINSDPKIKQTYQVFKSSITPQQEQTLKEQYKWSQAHEGEQRSYEEWKNATGLPAYFRGYAFQQWPAEFNQKAYTPEQMKLLDGMMQYLQGAK